MRKPRLIIPGVIYHVYGQINRLQNELTSDEIKKLFWNVFEEAHEKYKFSIESITIMNNHYHILIRPEFEYSLSRIMQWVLGVFAMRFNKIYNFQGHVWRGRFKSKPVLSTLYYVRLLIYLAQNPVRAKLVNKMEEWFFSSYTIIMQNKLEWYSLFGLTMDKIEKIKSIYSRFVNSPA